jgi:hypothetical protein
MARHLGRVSITFFLIASCVVFRAASAQDEDEAVVEEVLDFPGFGEIDLNQVEPEERDGILLPQLYDQGEETVGDLPPLEKADQAPQLPEVWPGQGEDAAPQPHWVPPVEDEKPDVEPALDDRRERRKELAREMYDERAYPNEKIPEGAYERAWEQIRQMPPALQLEPLDMPASPLPDQGSWWTPLTKQLVAWLHPRALNAIPASPAWTSVGPSSLPALQPERLGRALLVRLH